ncbi:hypothetical protein LEWO105114_05755 [Legionella worsleiensis]|uniref:Uncharacterized protein n=1 Tax=Legionella worsleiensis TaxID=45076 RepID=A0A0W1AG75_9GAMM|nr:hypothetical protein Lwor_1017 [Legionella worsleiensis]STY32751.1 Uncharacterised protein [Legionella worsleiensis]
MRLNKYQILIILIFPCVARAEETPNENSILYCPEKVICNSTNNIEDYHISVNEYDIWGKPSYGEKTRSAPRYLG